MRFSSQTTVILLSCIFLAPFPAFGQEKVSAKTETAETLLQRMQLEVGDLPTGFEIDSEFLPNTADDSGVESTSGIIFQQSLREGASVILGVNLYLFPTSTNARVFYDQMMQGDKDSIEFAVGERARGKSKEQPSPYRKGFPASALLFQRDRVVAFLLTGQLDGNVADGAYLQRNEILDLDGLVEGARILDKKIIKEVRP